MKNHCFSFLEDSYADVCNEAMFCEKHLVQKNFVDSILRAGKASEIMTQYICEFENQDYLISSGQKNRLKKLVYNGTISNSLYDELNFIRETRNKAAHGHVRNLEDNAKKVHFYLYIIATYFFITYKDPNFKIKEYAGPIMKAEFIPAESHNDEIKKDNEEVNIKSSLLENYPFALMMIAIY